MDLRGILGNRLGMLQGLKSQRRVHRSRGTVRRQVCVLGILLAAAILLRDATAMFGLSSFAAGMSLSEADLHSLERLLFLPPVAYATGAFGSRGGGGTLIFAAAVMIARAAMGPTDQAPQSLLQTAGVTMTGGLFVLWLASESRRADTAGDTVKQILMAQEREQQRIARELHDDTVQSLYVIAQGLDRVASNDDERMDAKTASELSKIRGTALQTVTGLRRLIQDLRPHVLSDMGFVPALEWMVDDHAKRYATAARLELRGRLPVLSQKAQLLLWRIAQEAMRNSGKYADASEILVTLDSAESTFRMVVADSGKGFDPRQVLRDSHRTGRMGILSMQERTALLGGSFEIHAEPGKGSVITVEIPLKPAD